MIQVVPEVVNNLKCRHGCDEGIVGIFYFPNGCLCFPDQIQALCRQHMERAASNVTHGPMMRLLSFGDWPDCAPVD
jgi:hypothetical protein